MVASAILLGAGSSRAAPTAVPAVSVVLAPSNLGLRPENGQQPGTWQAPRVLMEAGLREALDAYEVLCLPRPLYEIEAQPRTRIRNGRTIRAFSFALAEKVQGILEAGRFPVVIGGDCSVLLGSLYGARLAGGRGLVHVDGHSDFTQEKSYATPADARRRRRHGPRARERAGRAAPDGVARPRGSARAGRRHRAGRRARRPRAVVQGVLRRHPGDRDHPPGRAGRARRGHRSGCRARDRAARRARPRPRLAARRSRRAGREGDARRRLARQPGIRLRAARRTRGPPCGQRAHRRRRLRHLRPRARPGHAHARDLVACIAAGIGRRTALLETA